MFLYPEETEKEPGESKRTNVPKRVKWSTGTLDAGYVFVLKNTTNLAWQGRGLNMQHTSANMSQNHHNRRW